ncbi:methyltransferase type 11 [Leptolyngbya valderiana BDU 20041]|nr:methyltransferase type 11 [Leptolyngbya valderiana BDU 20041]PPT10780.1 Methyltransferase type 11 [Geitlerinema sp. FC II]
MKTSERELQQGYQLRFARIANYRRKVWKILVTRYFQDLVGERRDILDLGCGWGEFINQVRARKKYAMDLNPDAKDYLESEVRFIHQDCSQSWPVSEASLDVVFTSNFLEHLLSKESLSRTIAEAYRCLKPGGKIICLGPNIKYTGGAYWDFFDHHLPLTEASISEVLKLRGFQIQTCIPKFLPYTMANGKQPPLWTVSLYISMPLAWHFLGKQFLVVACKN